MLHTPPRLTVGNTSTLEIGGPTIVQSPPTNAKPAPLHISSAPSSACCSSPCTASISKTLPGHTSLGLVPTSISPGVLLSLLLWGCFATSFVLPALPSSCHPLNPSTASSSNGPIQLLLSSIVPKLNSRFDFVHPF